jgi:Zn-dependent protease
VIGDLSTQLPLTRDARAIVDRAGEIAKQRGAPEATSGDVLEATRQLQPQLVSSVKAATALDGAPGLSMRRLLVNASREAQSMGHLQVTPVHLLLAMLYSDSPVTAQALQEAGLSLYGVRQQAQQAQPLGPALRSEMRSGVINISPVFLGIVGVAAFSGALLWTDLFPGLLVPLTLTFVVAGWVISLCVHEFGHAFVAYLGGDHAVVASGYLTLNPLRYANVALSIVLPVVFLLLGGVALPGGAVYINHSSLRGPRWSSLVSLAGPFGTFLCWLLVALGFTFAFRVGLVTGDNIEFFAALAVLEFFLTFALVLNLLPVPGLDGFGVIRPYLSREAQYSAMRYGMVAILGVYAVLWFVAPVRDAFFQLIFSITTVAGVPIQLIFGGLLHMRIF